jgi:hypothetical protein
MGRKYRSIAVHSRHGCPILPIHPTCHSIAPRARIESSVAFKRIKITYTWELDATVTTFRRSSGLLDVKVSKLTAGGLDDADLVRSGVVSVGEISKVLRPK